MARVVAKVGDWIRVPVREGEFPLYMAIGNGAPVPAFIDRIKTGDRIDTFAAIRCPEGLKPGRNIPVRVIAPGRVVEAQLVVQP